MNIVLVFFIFMGTDTYRGAFFPPLFPLLSDVHVPDTSLHVLCFGTSYDLLSLMRCADTAIRHSASKYRIKIAFFFLTG